MLCTAVPFEETQPRLYVAELPFNSAIELSVLFIGMRSCLSDQAVVSKTPSHVLVTTLSAGPQTTRVPFPQATLQHYAHLPPALAAKPSYHYFRLSLAEASLTALRRENKVTVYVPSEFGDVAMELLIWLNE